MDRLRHLGGQGYTASGDRSAAGGMEQDHEQQAATRVVVNPGHEEREGDGRDQQRQEGG